jgi:plasmid stabilization system protein ParE
MAYKVIIMPPAKRRLDVYVQYTLEELKNRQAAKAILEDAKETKRRLSEVADSLKICDDPLLAKYEYRKISFLRHRFMMIYRIQDGIVIVDGMFHELQDYEGIFADEMHLS